jgi:hypothetical protein
MRSIQFQREGKRMIDSNPRLASRGSAWHAGTFLAAGFLILVGVVFQLAQFGFDGLAVKNLWFISMIAGNIWNFLAARSNLPAFGELLRFWPMLIVATGIALLAIPFSTCAGRLCLSQARMTDRD